MNIAALTETKELEGTKQRGDYTTVLHIMASVGKRAASEV